MSCEGGRSAVRHWQVEDSDPRLSKRSWATQARRGESGKGGVFEATEKGVEDGEKNGLVLHDAPVLVA